MERKPPALRIVSRWDLRPPCDRCCRAFDLASPPANAPNPIPTPPCRNGGAFLAPLATPVTRETDRKLVA